MPDDFPNIKFDSNGVCNYCHEWDRKWSTFDYAKAERELVTIFDSAKAKKRRYDCLIPYSGGRDSSYVVYLCKNRYGLNPLVVTFNNLFMSQHAIQNIFNMSKILNVDHVMVTYKPDILMKMYRAMIKGGGEFCSICTTGINYVKIIYQKLFSIPLIISGTSTRVDEQSPFEVTSTHPLYVRRVLIKSGFFSDEINSLLIKRQYELSVFEKIRIKLFDTDYVQINLPDYIPWDNMEIQQVLENELGWETPHKHKDHIDCKFASIKYYLKNKQIPNFIFTQEKYSQLIRDRQMTRKEALKLLDKKIQNERYEPEAFDDFLNFFNLQRKDIDNKAGKSHLDYIAKDELAIKEGVLLKLMSTPWKIYKKLKH
ncbi:hypothetical protein KAJ89_04970 [Candidatus Parcubacteria bacterium]|nr:hypothetical protein [Candidatus Parcubacteria bacterium]